MSRQVTVQWCDDAEMVKMAKDRGWTEDSPFSILDLVEEGEASKSKTFETMAKAKEWARRNKMNDFWRQPSVVVYEYPNNLMRSWQREIAKHLRYVGDGCGWDDLTV
jgi:hypothetical protein